MDATTLLQQRVSIEEVMKHYDFDKTRPDKHIIRSCCKLHGGDNPTGFVANTENNLWFCHTGGCGGGDIFTLVELMEEIPFNQAVEFVARTFDVDITNLEIKKREETFMKEMKAWIRAITSRKKKEMQEYSIPEEIKEVTKFRNFTEDTLRRFGLGWVESVRLKKKDDNTYTLKNRLVFPIWFNNVRVAYLFRRVKSTDIQKWSNQPVNVDTSELLYNYDMVLGEREIVVVEGVLDVWAYHEIGVPAVATFGAHLTDAQYKLLIRTGADITFSYDGDEAGRVATKKAIESMKYKANLRQVVFEDGEDPESIPRNQLKLNYERRMRV